MGNLTAVDAFVHEKELVINTSLYYFKHVVTHITHNV